MYMPKLVLLAALQCYGCKHVHTFQLTSSFMCINACKLNSVCCKMHANQIYKEKFSFKCRPPGFNLNALNMYAKCEKTSLKKIKCVPFKGHSLKLFKVSSIIMRQFLKIFITSGVRERSITMCPLTTFQGRVVP